VQPPRAFATARRGYGVAKPAERASFWILSATSLSILVARAVSYALERRRRAPPLRSLARRAYHAPGAERPRIHHFVPGIGVIAASGAAAIATHEDGRELRFGVPFGVGAGLTLDEIGLLLKLDNPYWSRQRLVLAESAASASVALALAARFTARAGDAAPAGA
jgi:hypothetical protein